ncbi:MAG: hypothetical protein HC901_01200 [Bdellovibrionaceae bacterium]|nr:hypothetical protein [Pseudobdellovibrionaceae bacterium]
MLRNLKLLAGACKELQIPIVLTEQYPEGLGATVPELAAVLKGVKPVSKTRFPPPKPSWRPTPDGAPCWWRGLKPTSACARPSTS